MNAAGMQQNMGLRSKYMIIMYNLSELCLLEFILISRTSTRQRGDPDSISRPRHFSSCWCLITEPET